jgi:hypothetical protein
MVAPNIVNVNMIRGRNIVHRTLTANSQVIVFNEPASSKVYKINDIVVSNVNGNTASDITVDITKNNTAYSIIKTATVPADSSMVVVSKDTSIYLEESMAITAAASAGNNLVVSCTYEEIAETPSAVIPNYENFHPAPLNIFSWANGSFLNNCTIAVDPSTGKSPLAGLPLKMTVTGADPHFSTYNGSQWNIAPAANGQTWRVKVWCKASVPGSIQIFIFGANAGGAFANVGGDIGAAGFATTTEWAEYSFDYTFANATIAFIQTRLDGTEPGGVGDEIWFDYLQVYRIS